MSRNILDFNTSNVTIQPVSFLDVNVILLFQYI